MGRQKMTPEERAITSAAAKESWRRGRKPQWVTLFREALEDGDIETATAIMVEQIRLRLREPA